MFPSENIGFSLSPYKVISLLPYSNTKEKVLLHMFSEGSNTSTPELFGTSVRPTWERKKYISLEQLAELAPEQFN